MAIKYVRAINAKVYELGDRGAQVFREEYHVRSDNPNETRAAILGASGVPAYGTIKSGTNAVCRKVSAERLAEDPYLWRVVAEWSTVTGDRAPNEDQKQPDQRRPQWSMRFTPIQKAFGYDLDGLPFCDRAGTPFNPPPQIPIYVDEVTIRRYQATCDRAYDRQFLNATNDDAWCGCAPNEALIADISADEVYEYGAYWFLYTYKILVSPRAVLQSGEIVGGWNPIYVLNAGPRELVYVDENGAALPRPRSQPIQESGYLDGQPHPLDLWGRRLKRDPGTGQWVAPDKDPWGQASSYTLVQHMYLAFRVVKTASFAALNLTPPWI